MAGVKDREPGEGETDAQGRRTFLKGAAAGALALGLSGCSRPNSPVAGVDGGGGGDGGQQTNDPQCIDVHTHIILLEPAQTTPEAGRAAADELIRRMDLAGVDKVVLLAITERLLWGWASIPEDDR